MLPPLSVLKIQEIRGQPSGPYNAALFLDPAVPLVTLRFCPPTITPLDPALILDWLLSYRACVVIELHVNYFDICGVYLAGSNIVMENGGVNYAMPDYAC